MFLASYARRRQMTDFAKWAKMTICEPQPSLVLISKVRFDLSSVFSVLSLPCRWLGAVAEHLGWSNPTALKWLKSSFVCSDLQNRTFEEFGKNRFSNHFWLILMLKHDFSRCFSLETPFADSNEKQIFWVQIFDLPQNHFIGPVFSCLTCDQVVAKWSKNWKIFKEPQMLFLG